MKVISEVMDAALHPVAAAAIGALVGLKAVAGASFAERAVNLAASFGLAVYAGPALVEHLGVTSPKIAAAIVMGCGATGLVFFNAGIEAIKQTNLVEWLTSWLPRRKG